MQQQQELDQETQLDQEIVMFEQELEQQQLDQEIAELLQVKELDQEPDQEIAELLQEEIDCLSRAAEATEGPPGARARPRWKSGIIKIHRQPSYDPTTSCKDKKVVSKGNSKKRKGKGDNKVKGDDDDDDEWMTHYTNLRPGKGDQKVKGKGDKKVKGKVGTRARARRFLKLKGKDKQIKGKVTSKDKCGDADL
jgi:hypothetical protein